MDTEAILKQLEQFQLNLFIRRENRVEPADPVTLSNNLLLIRGLLMQLVDKVAEADRNYRNSKAARFDKFLKDGQKKSPAMDAVKMESDLIELEIASERLKNYMRYTDGLCTSIQSVLKVQSTSDKSSY